MKLWLVKTFLLQAKIMSHWHGVKTCKLDQLQISLFSEILINFYGTKLYILVHMEQLDNFAVLYTMRQDDLRLDGFCYGSDFSQQTCYCLLL